MEPMFKFLIKGWKCKEVKTLSTSFMLKVQSRFLRDRGLLLLFYKIEEEEEEEGGGGENAAGAAAVAVILSQVCQNLKPFCLKPAAAVLIQVC